MVLDKTIELFSEIVGIDKNDISEETEFTKEFGIEPIDIAKLIIMVEKKFNIKIHDEYVSGFQNIGDLVLYIEEALDSY